MKWTILEDINVDNMNDFLNAFTEDGAIHIRNEHVCGIVMCHYERED